MIPELGILVIALLVLAFLGYICACTMSGRYEPIILLWALLAPLGYSVLAYPHERSIITLHRAVILPLLFLIPAFPPPALGKVNRNLTWLAIAWGFFVLGAMLSLVNVSPGQRLAPIRLAIDAFILPPLLGWAVYKTFRVRQHLSWLHIILSVVSIYLAIIGGLEIYLGQALMPQAGAGDVLYAGGGLIETVRPTGPYANPATLSLIGMINLFLLLFCRRGMGKAALRNVLLHWPGIVASVLVSLMTFTRGVVLAFAVIAVIEMWRAAGVKQRVLRGAGAGALLAVVAAAVAFAPSQIASERTSQDNFWGRVAQQVQTFDVFLDHPLIGIGLCNFGSVAGLTSKYETSVQGYDPVGAPHNLLGEVFSDTGLVGAIPFVISQMLLLTIFRKLRTSSPLTGSFVWSYFVMIFVAYWVLNMDFGIGYYSELNLWFVFALAVLYRYAIEQDAKPGIVAEFRPSQIASRGIGTLRPQC